MMKRFDAIGLEQYFPLSSGFKEEPRRRDNHHFSKMGETISLGGTGIELTHASETELLSKHKQYPKPNSPDLMRISVAARERRE